jgi:ferrochelatase
LLENSQKQAAALENHLNETGEDTYKTFVCMRYWHPMAPQVVREVRDWGAEQVVLLPLYPQFSTTTTWSSLEQWNKAADIAEYHPPTSMACCYPYADGYVKASAENVRAAYKQARENLKDKDVPPPRVLFSAHGLPAKIIKQGDPYQWQCEQSAEAIVKELDMPDLDWQICYQSRVGPLKWIGPSTDEAIEKAGADGVPLLVYPHAFTQEHVETLVEIDVEYREVADKLGIPYFARVDTVGVKEAFITDLAKLVQHYAGMTGIYGAPEQQHICPQKFGRCCMVMKGYADKKTEKDAA